MFKTNIVYRYTIRINENTTQTMQYCWYYFPVKGRRRSTKLYKTIKPLNTFDKFLPVLF